MERDHVLVHGGEVRLISLFQVIHFTHRAKIIRDYENRTISVLHASASYLAEGYDNVGLITGKCRPGHHGSIGLPDSTEEVILEAIDKKCNLVIAHHPDYIQRVKKLVGGNHVGENGYQSHPT